MFLCDDGVIKLSDYLLQEQMNRPYSGKNTAWYMAPEVFEGREEEKSDVWSLGISLMELAEGCNPFEECDGEVKRRVCDGEPPCLSSEKWSPVFVDFVSKCLVKDVKERWCVNTLMNVSVMLKNNE